jgi:5'-3' exonuclease
VPDLLALVGDDADGYPGIKGIGMKSAARLLNEFGPIENFPQNILGKKHEQALLFKKLATLRTDVALFSDVEEMRWKGPASAFMKFTKKINEPRLLERANKTAAKL